MFTNFLLCCSHACCCCKNIVTNFNVAIVISVGIVSLFAFLATLLYYGYRKKELETFASYRKSNDNNTNSANQQKGEQKQKCILARFFKC